MDEAGKHHAESRKPDEPDHTNISVCDRYKSTETQCPFAVARAGGPGRKWDRNANRGFLL